MNIMEKLYFYNQLNSNEAIEAKIAGIPRQTWLTHAFFGMGASHIANLRAEYEDKANDVYTCSQNWSSVWASRYLPGGQYEWPAINENPVVLLDQESYKSFPSHTDEHKARITERIGELDQLVRSSLPDKIIGSYRNFGYQTHHLIWQAYGGQLGQNDPHSWAERLLAVEGHADFVAIPAYIAPASYPWAEDEWQDAMETATQFLIDVAEIAGKPTCAYTGAKKGGASRVDDDVYAAWLHWLRDRVPSTCVMIPKEAQADGDESVLRSLDITLGVLA